MQISLRINDFLIGLFLGIGIRLVDFKLEFGRLYSEDDMRIVARRRDQPRQLAGCGTSRPTRSSTRTASAEDLGKVEEAYQEVARRLGILPEGGPARLQGARGAMQ